MSGADRELRVPTTALEMEVLCADGRTFRGRVFLPDLSPHHSGAVRPAEWTNEPAGFFPFLSADEKAPFLLNRSEVLAFTISAEADADEDADAEGGVHRRVIVECRDRRFEGEIIIDMPPHLSRVLDYLNRPDPFLIVRDGPRHHLIRKARITRVIEPRET